jgi:transcriptional regulator with XRE-family HTH domain
MGGSAGDPGQFCAGCGRPLSRYNTGPCCQARVSAARKDPPGRSGKASETLVDGGRLAQLRHDHGWTQELLAGRAGLSTELVKKLEQGAKRSARLSTLGALARALNVPVGVLLGDSPGGQSPADEPAAGPGGRAGEPIRPTLLRALIAERHWQTFRAFQAQFRRAARDLAERDGDPDLAKLTVSSRQWERWYSGGVKTEPYPDACRVLEHMFGHPVQQLLAPANQASAPDDADGAFGEAESLASSRVRPVRHSAADRLGRADLSYSSLVVPSRPQGNDTDLVPEPSPAIGELCAVLTEYGSNPRQFGSVQHDEIPLHRDLERDIVIAFNAYQHSRFATTASRVSVLLADAQLAARECKEEDRATVLKILALAYQAAASVLIKVGEPDIAWIAAERGLNAAEAAGGSAVRGSLMRSVAFALHSTGRPEAAMRLVDSVADHLRGEIVGNDAVLSVYGTILLVGSMAAARFGDGPKAEDYLREAHIAAQRLGKDANHLWTAFGPTNVAIHRVNTAVELGDIQTVLDSGLSLNTAAVPAERRVRYLLDVARAHALTGNRDDALSTMLTAERIAPEQVRQHYLSREVVVILMQRAVGRPGVQLDRLAKRVKILEWA